MAKRKHVIIECGPAALSALEKIRALTPEEEVKLVTMDDYPPLLSSLPPLPAVGKDNGSGTVDEG